jgi:hypothetical protein
VANDAADDPDAGESLRHAGKQSSLKFSPSNQFLLRVLRVFVFFVFFVANDAADDPDAGESSRHAGKQSSLKFSPSINFFFVFFVSSCSSCSSWPMTLLMIQMPVKAVDPE